MGWHGCWITEGEAARGKWRFHLLHVGMLEGEEPAGFPQHRFAAGHGGTPSLGGDSAEGACPLTGPRRLAPFLWLEM